MTFLRECWFRFYSNLPVLFAFNMVLSKSRLCDIWAVAFVNPF